MSVSTACYVCAPCAHLVLQGQNDSDHLELDNNGCESPYGSWDLNPEPLQEQ